MKMLRHYFISDNLDDLEAIEQQLEAEGVDNAQIHVLSDQDSEVEQHNHLHQVKSFARKDVVQSTIIGASIGVFTSCFVLLVSRIAGWTETPAGWLPFLFLAIVLLGFCTWEGGLVGMQKINRDFERFRQVLASNQHVFFVDLEPSQEAILDRVLQAHPGARAAGTGHSMPHWLLSLRIGLRKIFRIWP